MTGVRERGDRGTGKKGKGKTEGGEDKWNGGRRN